MNTKQTPLELYTIVGLKEALGEIFHTHDLCTERLSCPIHSKHLPSQTRLYFELGGNLVTFAEKADFALLLFHFNIFPYLWQTACACVIYFLHFLYRLRSKQEREGECYRVRAVKVNMWTWEQFKAAHLNANYSLLFVMLMNMVGYPLLPAIHKSQFMMLNERCKWQKDKNRKTGWSREHFSFCLMFFSPCHMKYFHSITHWLISCCWYSHYKKGLVKTGFLS